MKELRFNSEDTHGTYVTVIGPTALNKPTLSLLIGWCFLCFCFEHVSRCWSFVTAGDVDFRPGWRSHVTFTRWSCWASRGRYWRCETCPVSSWSSSSCQSDASLFVLVPVFKQSPHPIRKETPYVTVLACWASQDEADTDSSNEEEGVGVSPAPSGANGPTEGDPASNPSLNTNKYVYCIQ